MEKGKIILISALIIGVFALLFLLEKPNVAPKSEAESLIDQYKGNPGFVIVSLPRFLINQVIIGEQDNFEEQKKAISSVKVMIYHEEKSTVTSRSSLDSTLNKELQSLDFKILEQKKDSSSYNTIFHKVLDEKWNEAIYIYSNDSSLFLFDIINSLNINEIKNLSDSIDAEGLNF